MSVGEAKKLNELAGYDVSVLLQYKTSKKITQFDSLDTKKHGADFTFFTILFLAWLLQ